MTKVIRNEFTLPRFDNSGDPFPPAMFRNVERELLTMVSGFTVWQSNGKYVDPEQKKVYHDKNRTYVVVTDGDTSNCLRDFMEELKARFRQQAIYFFQSPGQVEFI